MIGNTFRGSNFAKMLFAATVASCPLLAPTELQAQTAPAVIVLSCTWPSNPPNIQTITLDLGQKTVTTKETLAGNTLQHGTITQITDQDITWNYPTTDVTSALDRYTLRLQFGDGTSEQCELQHRQL